NLSQVELPAGREGHAMPPQPRRQHAVEHVDAARDGLEQVARRADSHQVPWAVLGQRRAGGLERGPGLASGLPDAQTADTVAVEAQRAEGPGGELTEVRVGAALHD